MISVKNTEKIMTGGPDTIESMFFQWLENNYSCDCNCNCNCSLFLYDVIDKIVDQVTGNEVFKGPDV